MSAQEEPESQIDFSLYQHTNEQDSPPPLDCDDHADAQHEPHRLRNGNDDPVLDDNIAPISSPHSQHGVLRSQVEETQFVSIERDTQLSINYDMSPTTRRVLENTESSSAKLSPPLMVIPLLERREVPALPDSPKFRFGKPPKPDNMNLTRRPPGPIRPGQLEVTNMETLASSQDSLPVTDRAMSSLATGPETNLTTVPVTPSTAIRTQPGCDGPPGVTFTLEEDPDSALPDTPTEPTHSPDQATAQTDEVVRVNSSKLHFQSTPTLSDSRSRIEEPLPRYI
jgi:hypothetical protein